jgi:hypothetical protein
MTSQYLKKPSTDGAFYNLKTVVQLKMECRTLGIKGFSKFKKADLIKFLISKKEDIDQERKIEIQNNLEQEDSIYSFPGIIDMIHSYAKSDENLEKRKEIVNFYKAQYDRSIICFETCRLQNISSYDKKIMLLDNGFTARKYHLFYDGFYHLRNDLYMSKTFTYDKETLLTKNKTILMDWAKKLNFKVSQKMKKSQIVEIVMREYDLIYNY